MSTTRPPARRLTQGTAALAVALASLTACGGDSGTDAGAASAPTTTAAAPTSESAATRSITATEADFSISLDDDGLAPGSYEIEVVNDGSATHDLVVERDGEDVASSRTIAPGASVTLGVELEAGEYVFYCSIGNHREMGMEIDVTVA
jgi:uncharacterized cupredoxin-like copper-binding protein